MFFRIALIACVNFLLYARTIKYGPVSDDIPTLKSTPKVKNPFYRFYLRLFEGAKYHMPTEHIYTISVHSIVAILIYLAFGHTDMSFVAALLFSFNPANNQGSIWVSGRGYAMTAVLLLASIWLPYLSPLFLIMAVHHPAGYFAPFAFLGAPFWWLLPCAIPAWALKFRRFKGAVNAKMSAEAFPDDKRINFRRLLIALKTYGFYFTLAIIPFTITFYHNLLESAAGNPSRRRRAARPNVFTWIGLIAIIGFIVRSCYVWDSISWGILWFNVCIAPFCNLIRMNQEIAERYIYVANVGLMYALAQIIAPYPLAVAIFITAYIVKMWQVMPMYTDDYWVIEFAVIEDPRSWFAWHVRGHKMLERGGINEALSMFVMARLLSPKEFKLLFNISVLLRMIRKTEESDKFLQLAKDNIIEGQEEKSLQLIEDVKKGKMPFIL